jgi:hypothetical protein
MSKVRVVEVGGNDLLCVQMYTPMSKVDVQMEHRRRWDVRGICNRNRGVEDWW